MKRNMGIFDRLIRILIAVVIGILYFTGQIYEFGAIVGLVIAAIFLITGIVSTCPLYTALGITSRKQKSEDA